MEPEDLGEIWQAQAVETLTLSSAEIEAKAAELGGTVAARNRREWTAGGVVALCFAATAVVAEGIARVGSLLIVIACVWIAAVIRVRGRTGAAEDLPGAVFYRRELERQRALLRGVWWWYLGPLALGMVVFAIGVAIKSPGILGVVLAVVIIAGTALRFMQIGQLNMRVAAELQRQIDALPPTERSEG